jgi:hypothetical protein
MDEKEVRAWRPHGWPHVGVQLNVVTRAHEDVSAHA